MISRDNPRGVRRTYQPEYAHRHPFNPGSVWLLTREGQRVSAAEIFFDRLLSRGVMGAAAYLPARRALGVQPIDAMRRI